MGLLKALQAEVKKRTAAGDRRDLVINAEDVDQLVREYLAWGGQATAHLNHKNVADKIRRNEMRVSGYLLTVSNRPKPPPPPFVPRAVKRTL